MAPFITRFYFWLPAIASVVGYILQSPQRADNVRFAKELIDRIDERLSEIYGLNGEQADFIKNYDVKYRLAGTDETEVVGSN